MNSISMCNSSGSRILFDISNEQKDAYGADQESVQVQPMESCDRFSKRKEVVDQMKKQDQLHKLNRQQVKMSKANKIRVVQRTSQRVNNMSAYDIRKQSIIKKKAKKEACVNGG